jgi:tRNA pseudouridine13 synthase
MDALQVALAGLRAGMPPLGGRIKSDQEDFVVEEIPAYEPCGAGDHVYLRHRRKGRATRELVLDLAREFDLHERDVGHAGMKDKHAVAEQTFSLPLSKASEAEVLERAARRLGGEALWAKRHGNKLKRGHSRGNRFTVRVVGTRAGAADDAPAMLEEARRRGLPNAFGPQRFGRDGSNAARGAELLRAGRSRGWLAELQLNAWQAQVFNHWLGLRAQAGLLDLVVEGDVAKKTVNGALFDVVDAALEAPRAERLEIVATGPMWGRSMRRASGRADELEQAALAASGLAQADLARTRLEGTRRAARVLVEDADSFAGGASDLILRFALPKGCYATTLVAAMCGDEAVLPHEEQDD